MAKRSFTLLRRRRACLVWSGRPVVMLASTLVVVLAVAGFGLVSGYAVAVAAGLAVLAATFVTGLRTRGAVSGGPGGWPEPPDGAGVREPRRPLPLAPSGAAFAPRPS